MKIKELIKQLQRFHDLNADVVLIDEDIDMKDSFFNSYPIKSVSSQILISIDGESSYNVGIIFSKILDSDSPDQSKDDPDSS